RFHPRTSRNHAFPLRRQVPRCTQPAREKFCHSRSTSHPKPPPGCPVASARRHDSIPIAVKRRRFNSPANKKRSSARPEPTAQLHVCSGVLGGQGAGEQGIGIDHLVVLIDSEVEM